MTLNIQLNKDLAEADRFDLLGPECYQQFASLFKLKKSKNAINNSRLALKTTREMHNQVFICKPMYSSRKLGKNYKKYCVYSFIRFGDWEGLPLSEIMDESLAVARWENFIVNCSTSMKAYIKIELDVNGLLQQVVADMDIVEEQEEQDPEMDPWMLVGNDGPLYAGGQEDDLTETITYTPNIDWAERRVLQYTPAQLVEAREFLSSLGGSNAERTARKVVTRLMLNEKQRIVHDIAKDAYTSDEQVLCILIGTAGTGKSHVIHSLWQIYDNSELVLCSANAKAAFLVGGMFFH